jgi:hypothetical protein
MREVYEKVDNNRCWCLSVLMLFLAAGGFTWGFIDLYASAHDQGQTCFAHWNCSPVQGDAAGRTCYCSDEDSSRCEGKWAWEWCYNNICKPRSGPARSGCIQVTESGQILEVDKEWTKSWRAIGALMGIIASALAMLIGLCALCILPRPGTLRSHSYVHVPVRIV